MTASKKGRPTGKNQPDTRGKAPGKGGRSAEAAASPNGLRSFMTAGGLVFIVALVIRLLFLADMSESPTFQVPVVDSFVYHEAAASLAQGRGFESTFFFQPFFYPLILSLIYTVFGISIVVAKGVQALVGALTCLLVYRLARRFFSKTTSLVAGFMVALYSPLIFFEAELLATGLAAFESVALVLLFLKARESRSPAFFIFFGFFCAVCTLTRPTFLPVIMVGAAWLLHGFYSSESTRTAAFRPLGVGLLGFLIPVFTVALINRQHTGNFGFLPTSGGINFYLGNNENYEETVNARMGSEWSDLLHLPQLEEAQLDKVPDDGLSRSRFYFGQSMAFAASEPFAFASGMGRKALQIVSAREIPRNVDIYLFRKWSWLLQGLLWKTGGFGFPFGVLFPLAVAGWFLCWRRMPFVLLMTVVVYSLSVVAVFVTARYRIPLVPLLAVPAAAGITGLWHAIWERKRKQLGLAGLALLGSVLVATMPGPFVAERMDYEAELHCCIGDSLRRTGRLETAYEQFRQAVFLDPGNAEAQADLAQLQAARGELDEAIASCRAALKLKPGMIRAINNLGSLLSDRGKHDEAEKVCRQGLELRPHDAALHFNVAKALAGKGDVEGAREQLEMALDCDPMNGPALFEMARIYEREGRIDEAVSLYTEAVEAAPDAGTLSTLADLYARQGKMDEALKWVSKAMELAPEDPGLHYRMAKALERLGRMDQAEHHLRETLRFAPAFPRAGYELGSYMMQAGRFSDAVAPLEDAVRADPHAPEPCHMLAVALAAADRGREAVERYGQALKMAPGYVPSLSGLAWLKATHPDGALRNGKEALVLAERAVAIDRANPNVLNTLAAAYAEAGRFAAAVETADKAISSAERSGQAVLAAQIRDRLTWYRQGKAFRDTSYRKQ